MKVSNFFALTLAIIMSLTLTACGEDTSATDNTPTDTSANTTTTTTPLTTTEPPTTVELSDEPEEPQEPVITAVELGLVFNPQPDRMNNDQNMRVLQNGL